MELLINIFNNPLIFFPTSTQNFEQNKNAIIKFIIYSSIIILLFTGNISIFIICVIIAILIAITCNKIITAKQSFDIKNYDNNNKCRKSTIENPMGNILLYTPADKMNEKLCDNQEKKIEDNLTYNIYYDSHDLFNKKNNTRSFITMPSQTHPNDIDKFKKYVYFFGNPTCKSDGLDCMFNEDPLTDPKL